MAEQKSADKLSEVVAAGRVLLRQGTEIRAPWSGADHLELIFSDNLHLARVNDQYYLTFGHLRPSVDQPNDKPSPLTAELKPLVRLVVPKDALERMVKLLSQAMDRDTEET